MLRADVYATSGRLPGVLFFVLQNADDAVCVGKKLLDALAGVMAGFSFPLGNRCPSSMPRITDVPAGRVRL
ncbi:hypothetical protein [Geoalkalibacter subterraneus]|jgi:hypothetical protein|uniref:Uncharacterized protein n=1 Tax=Geoalkalibacter subterraneus TaxID=483547 RepID=A0A0B5FDT6_9BACT|nr:hypothetical protein [Geoalkalibacter subterraneus]AJF05458.1 hypothetical protein GSUB_01095 [Geoalkalibacter subterraneus]